MTCDVTEVELWFANTMVNWAENHIEVPLDAWLILGDYDLPDTLSSDDMLDGVDAMGLLDEDGNWTEAMYGFFDAIGVKVGVN